MEILTKGGGKR
ncbi:hypothetical protein HZS_3338 [Henneguya salminicola]|nr:hypothetical protein HZS_3338 [Henneguya salminicola]